MNPQQTFVQTNSLTSLDELRVMPDRRVPMQSYQNRWGGSRGPGVLNHRLAEGPYTWNIVTVPLIYFLSMIKSHRFADLKFCRIWAGALPNFHGARGDFLLLVVCICRIYKKPYLFGRLPAVCLDVIPFCAGIHAQIAINRIQQNRDYIAACTCVTGGAIDFDGGMYAVSAPPKYF